MRPEKIWSTPELHKLYIHHGGTEVNRYRFSCRFIQLMQSDILVLKSPGMSSVFMLKSKASSFIPLIDDDNEDEIDIHMKAVSTQIKKELKELLLDRLHYSKLNHETIFDECSYTLTSLLSLISPSLDKTVPSVIIGNIVTSAVKKACTELQLSLGVLARKKTLIEHLNAFKITSSYQEVRQFKISAAVNAESSVVPNLNAKLGLIQIISDNFDANISSQNGRKETHGLATIICQNPSDARETTERVPIPRLPFNQLKDVQLKNVNLKFYRGVKDPPMPQEFALCGVLPLKLLCQQVLSVKSSFIKDFEFIKSILTADNVADYHGFNTKLTQKSGECLKKKQISSTHHLLTINRQIHQRF